MTLIDRAQPKILEQFCSQYALKAGEILRSYYASDLDVDYKSNKFDLVTSADREVEEALVTTILKDFPSSGILAEEGGMYQEGELLWIIDPLDGTVNFAHRLPIFSVSIAVTLNRELIAAAVYQPIQQQLFTASKGNGAKCNGKPIRVSNVAQLESALLVTGFPYNVKENPQYCIDHFVAFLLKGLPIRRLGSAALDLAYVAAGFLDGFWEVQLHPWDVAAGILLVHEAGGLVTNYSGEPHPIFIESSLIASNGKIHSAMMEVIEQVYRSKRLQKKGS